MQIIQEFPRYRIDPEGNIWSCIAGRGKKARNTNEPQRLIKPVLDTTGYFVVSLTDGTRKVNRSIHRLLAQTYLPNPKALPHVNHIDGDQLNNSLNNLEWVSVGVNTRHAIDMGMTDPRTRSPSMQEVVKMDLVGSPIQTYMSLHDAGRMTGIAWQNISKVCKGQRKTAGGFRWCIK